MSRLSQSAALVATTAFAMALAGTALAGDDREGYSYLSYVGAEVSLVSQGEEDTTARINLPILAGDRITTGSVSRAEAVLADGNVVRFDVRSDVRFDRLARTYEADDDRDLLYLERGAMSVEARYAATRDRAIRVDTNDATILFPDRGLFRVDAGRRGTEIYVLEGRAEVTGRSGRAQVRAGEYAYVNGADEIDIDTGEFPRDRFTTFVDERRELGSPRRPAPQYVAADYAYDYSAGNLDDYGSWVDVPSYGNCWRPRVGGDWSPYSQGYWRWTPCGLTWVSYEPWGWLPYHYGSWTFDTGFGWCWLPGSSYSPAWVYWTYTPSYVGWCPMGYYGGYYGSYYGQYHRSTRFHHGYETATYPHLRGRVDLTQIDRRGWNFVSSTRLGARLDPRQDLKRGDRVTFNRGDVGVVSTAPLRVDRGGRSVVSAVQDAARRISLYDAPARSHDPAPAVDEGLTALLRRDKTPSRLVEDVYRGSVVRAGQDPAYHAATPEGLFSPRRGDGTSASTRGSDAGPGGVRGDVTLRGGPGGVVSRASPASPVTRSVEEFSPRRSWRDAPAAPGSSLRSDTVPQQPVRRDPDTSGARTGDGWRAQTSPAPRALQPRRVDEAPVRRDDSGWRAPQPETPRREAPPRSYEAPAPRSYDAPRREAPAPPPRSYEAPAPRSYEAPHREAPAPAPRSYEAPRREAPPPPPARYERYEAPRREYSAPRYEAPHRDAPRYEAPRSAPPSRSYDAPPSRSYSAPPSRSYEAPRSSSQSAPRPQHRPF